MPTLCEKFLNVFEGSQSLGFAKPIVVRPLPHWMLRLASSGTVSRRRGLNGVQTSKAPRLIAVFRSMLYLAPTVALSWSLPLEVNSTAERRDVQESGGTCRSSWSKYHKKQETH